MICKLELRCADCQKLFTAKKTLYYRNNFLVQQFEKIELVCDTCYKNWENYWQIKHADFREENCYYYVDVYLDNGQNFLNLDCTPMDDILVTSIDMPAQAKKQLYSLYKVWLDAQRQDLLKECTFNEEFMKTTFSCSTYGGEEYHNIAFRFNRKGELEVEKEIDEKILAQVTEAWQLSEITGNNHFKSK